MVAIILSGLRVWNLVYGLGRKKKVGRNASGTVFVLFRVTVRVRVGVKDRFGLRNLQRIVLGFGIYSWGWLEWIDATSRVTMWRTSHQLGGQSLMKSYRRL